LSSFFSKLFGRKTPEPSRLCLSAFGKHPGWDDHLEIGIETELLATVKQVLYVEGIGGNIESGAWDKLHPEQRLAGLWHSFLWRRGRQLAVGRLWASRDGKGRSRYPMVCCADCSDLPLPWVAEYVFPALERIETACMQTEAPDAVHAVLSVEADQLRQALPVAGAEYANESPQAAGDVISYLAKRSEMEPDHRKLLSVLYLMDTETAPFRDGRWGGGFRASAVDVRPLQMRVPPCASTPAEAALLWIRFLLGQVSDAAPILILQPLGEPWLDLILGEPTPSQCYCMLAKPSAIPLTTDIPYEMPAEFLRRARRMIGSTDAAAVDLKEQM
jgi:hypothetical protein